MASVRTRKKQIASHLFMAMMGRRLEAWLNESQSKPRRVKVPNWLESQSFEVGEYERLQAIEDAKVEYVVKKVNGGEVVATFDSREDALALVLKHHRQKKAKLHVMDSSTGELVLFTEEEMA